MANTQLGDSQKVPYVYGLNDADNQPVPLPSGAIASVTSDSPDSVAVVPDPTPVVANAIATGFLVGNTPKAGVNVTFSCKNADGSNVVADVVDAIDVVPGAATTATVTLGTPVAK